MDDSPGFLHLLSHCFPGCRQLCRQRQPGTGVNVVVAYQGRVSAFDAQYN